MSRAVLRLIGVWLALLVLLGVTLGAAFLPLGAWGVAIAYGIATIKAGLVVWIFMEMRSEDRIARLAMAAGFIWLSIMLVMLAADYAVRF